MPVPQRAVSVPIAHLGSEDQLFDGGTVRVVVDVSPEWRHAPNGDLILRGYIQEKEIEVVFPGRRRTAATQLMQRLQEVVGQIKVKAKSGGYRLAVGDVRQKLHVDGVWRVRLLSEDAGIPKRRFQLLAARWKFRGLNGVDHTDGEIPYG